VRRDALDGRDPVRCCVLAFFFCKGVGETHTTPIFFPHHTKHHKLNNKRLTKNPDQNNPQTTQKQKNSAELYPMPYASIDWNAARNLIAKEDLYYPHPLIQDALWWVLYKAENLLQGSYVRKLALSEVMRHIRYEDENTRYVDIGPVNKVVNMLCCWLDDPEGDAFKKHLPRYERCGWMGGVLLRGRDVCFFGLCSF
jgi:hypothetical protein